MHARFQQSLGSPLNNGDGAAQKVWPDEGVDEWHGEETKES